MKGGLVVVLVASLIALSLQEECHVVFNNIHNGLRYNIMGDCTITDTIFSVTPKNEVAGDFDKTREVQQHIIHKQADGTYKVDVSKARTDFGKQTVHHEQAVEFVLISESVREVAVIFIVKGTQADQLEKYLRSHAKSLRGDL